MNKRENIYYVNGKYILENEAKISVLDIGFLRGYGVFDFLVTYKEKPFLLDEHTKRLFNSAKLIGLSIGKTKTQINKIILNTLKRNSDGTDKTIRIVVTGGIGVNTTDPSNKSSIIVTVDERHFYPKKYYTKGVTVITFPYTRPLASAKSLDYAIGIKALKIAKKLRAPEAIYFDENTRIISEATTSNVFIVKDGKIFTPKNNILNGITRNLVIKLWKSSNPVIEKEISLNELLTADEVFITASNKEVMPVVKIDNIKVGDGKVGKTTKGTMKVFQTFVNSQYL